MGHSTARPSAAKPVVPAGFPLWWHPSGRWCKKVRGKCHYFGRDPDAALEEWLRVKDFLLAGRRPPPAGNVVTVADVADAFLNSRRRKLEAGELKRETHKGYIETMTRMVAVFGPGRPVETLGPEDFAQLREALAKTHGPSTLAVDVQQVRTCFRWALETELIPVVPRYGDFRKPPARVLRAVWSAKSRTMTASEIRGMIDAADPFMRCCLYLGINAGYGPHDCVALPRRCLDLDRGWLEFARPKTSVGRKAWLWPETVAALRAYEAVRPEPARPEWADLLFLSRWRRPYAADGSGCKPTIWFRELARKLGIYRPGLSAYSLRHTHRHVADQSLDQVACAVVMGHTDRSIAAVYRGEVSDTRIQAVCQAVRTWLYAPDPETGGDEQDGPTIFPFRSKVG